jgi:hypothetical protein
MSVQQGRNPPASMGPKETAAYTKEMLDSLRRIALQQNQHLLAHLLELAALEAKAQAETDN